MNFLKMACLVITFFISATVNASVVSVDWNNADDNLITYDTVTGLNWLDLTETRDLSYDSVFAELSGGTLDGWRYATSTEVVTLWQNFGVNFSVATSGEVGGTVKFSVDQGVLDAADILGDTYPASEFFGVVGFSSDLELLGAVVNSSSTFYYPLEYSATNSYVPENVGSYLVRTSNPGPIVSPVPVPAAAWLFGSALVGFFGVARRKARA